jgi:hypothetical protein
VQSGSPEAILQKSEVEALVNLPYSKSMNCIEVIPFDFEDEEDDDEDEEGIVDRMDGRGRPSGTSQADNVVAPFHRHSEPSLDQEVGRALLAV